MQSVEKNSFKKWKLDKYHKNTQLFWAVLFCINVSVGFIFERESGIIAGLLLSMILFILYGWMVGTHPEEPNDENWSISSDKFVKK